MKVKDLVQIEEVEEVVQITKHRPDKIVETFVADTRLEHQICFLLERFLNRTEKNSFFIIGSYGSGKSHLLAFLGDLFAHPNLWDRVRNESIRSYAVHFQDKSFVPIWIHLPSTKIDLRDYVWFEMEKQLGEILGKEVTLAPSQYIRTAEEDPRFENFLKEEFKESHREEWEYLKSFHPGKALELARKFFSRIGIRPVISEDVETVMDHTLKLLCEEMDKDTSIVLIIDELYDFLRGKGGGTAEFARDIAFLRDLGEASRNYKFFVLASLQEDILDPEKAGAEKDNLNRIRQRYEHLQIPYFNLQKVARERVLKKNQEQVEELRKLYSLLRQRYFPSLAFDEKSFVDLYPIHPSILHFYERVVREVGPRSIISFLSRSAVGIQDQPHDTLITVAELYDHLKDELASHTTFGVLVRDIVPRLEEGIFKWIESEDRDWALKAVKALCILHIVNERRKCQELAELILYKGMEDVNYQYFSHLMEKLVKAGTYLYRAEGTGIDAVYLIQTEGPPLDILIENEIMKIEDDDPALWGEVLENLKDNGMPRELEGQGWGGLRVDWRGTERKGIGRFIADIDEHILQEVKDRFDEEEDLDFALIILRPNLPPDYLSPKELPDERILVWRPAGLEKGDLYHLKRGLAIRRLIEGGPPKEMLDSLNQHARLAREKINELTENIYWKKGSLSFLSPPLPKPFTETLNKCVGNLLQLIYPQHPHFRRKITRKTTRDVIRYLSGISPPSPTVEDYAEQLSQGGLLVKEGEGRYVVREEGEFYTEIMDMLKSSEHPKKIADIYQRLREKPYGLTEEIVEFLILSLTNKGVVSIKGMGKEYFRHNLREILESNINIISSNYHLHKLVIIIIPEVLEFLQVVFGEVNANTPEETSSLWERVRELPHKYDFHKLEEKLQGFHPPFNNDLLLKRLENIKEPLQKLFEIIKDNPSPEEGFRKVGDLIKDEYSSFITYWQNLKTLYEIGELQSEVNREIDYLQQISLPPQDGLLKSRDELLAELEGDNVGDKEYIQRWRSRADFLKNGYIEKYIALHEEMVGNFAPWWGELEEIQKGEKLRTLGELWEIMGNVGESNPAEQLRREIYRLLEKKCNKLYKDSLLHHPLCPHCGFKPEASPDVGRDMRRIRTRLDELWMEIINELTAKREDIRSWLESASSTAKEGLEKLLNGEPIPLTEEMKEVLRRALGTINIIDIDLSPYIKDGGIYRVEDFMERIRQALKGVERGRNVRIRIKLK